MNIQSYLPVLRGNAPVLDTDAVSKMLEARSLVFRGFASLESRQGLLSLDLPLSDSRAQDSIRLLVYRYIEELFESRNATDHNHVLEEAIDAVNYLWALGLIERGYSDEGPENAFQIRLLSTLTNSLRDWFHNGPNVIPATLDDCDIAACLEPIFSSLSPKLRNRAWMNETQQTDFAYDALLSVIDSNMAILLALFDGWDEFWEFFMAKSQVLEFRLETKY